MEHPPHRIDLATTGALYIMPRPSAETLQEDIGELRARGIDHIVSLLGDDETVELGLTGERDACARHGIEFHSFPVPDFGVPAAGPLRDLSFRDLANAIKGWIDGGEHVVIHCRAGVGRSGTLACCVLQLFGVTADDAIARVSLARGVGVPETKEQRAFVRAFGETSSPAR